MEAGFKSTVVGHVGDGSLWVIHLLNNPLIRIDLFVGNFHALLLFRADSELVGIREAVHRMVERALALDGTCTFSSC